jgi:hypothetical protein
MNIIVIETFSGKPDITKFMNSLVALAKPRRIQIIVSEIVDNRENKPIPKEAKVENEPLLKIEHEEEINNYVIVPKKRIEIAQMKGDDNEQSKCPSCLIYVEIDRGCNFVTCQSQICSGRNIYFCGVCFKRLRESEKSTHFPEGIYGKFCINKPKNSEF